MKRKSTSQIIEVADNAGGKNKNIEEIEQEEIIDVSFDFQAPKETDFHAIKKLLSPLFPDCEPLSQLVDDIIENDGFGCSVYMLGQDEDSEGDGDDNTDSIQEPSDNTHNMQTEINDPVSISSLVNARPELNTWLVDNVKHAPKTDKIFINTRLINLPADLVPPSFDIIIKELGDGDKQGTNCKVVYMARMYCLNGQWDYYQFEDSLCQTLQFPK